jgi:hypothetical protein
MRYGSRAVQQEKGREQNPRPSTHKEETPQRNAARIPPRRSITAKRTSICFVMTVASGWSGRRSSCGRWHGRSGVSRQLQSSNTATVTSVMSAMTMALANVSKVSVSTNPTGSRKALGPCPTVCIVFLRPRHSKRPSGRVSSCVGRQPHQRTLGIKAGPFRPRKKYAGRGSARETQSEPKMRGTHT